jgi:hypothetical protein
MCRRELPFSFTPLPVGKWTFVARTTFWRRPSSQVLEPGVLAALAATRREAVLNYCKPATRCPVLFVDLNRDGESEALVFSNYGTVALRRLDGKWTVTERMQRLGAVASFNNSGTIRKALREGRYTVRDLGWQVLEIRGELYVLNDVPRPEPEQVKPAPDAE